MKYALKPLLSLSLLLPVVGCSPQEADSGQTSVAPTAGTPAPATLARSENSPAESTGTAELGAEASVTETADEEPQLDAFGRHSVYTGVYSEEQAARGLAIQEKECSACHTPDDWGSGNVLQDYTGMSAYDMVNRLRETMPMDEPGRLSLQQYTDVAAFIFQLNGAPAGDAEMPADPAELARIRLEYRR